MHTLKLRPVTNSPTGGLYSLRNDDQGHRIGVIYDRAHALQIVESVNALAGLNPDAIQGLVGAAENALAVGQIVGESKNRVKQALANFKD